MVAIFVLSSMCQQIWQNSMQVYKSNLYIQPYIQAIK